GDKDYPLGKEGFWISLVGTDANTIAANGYGIHGTNDPNSIGKASSLGCIRLADADIDLVFNLLYEEWSTVQVVP
ncbi:MAG: L,D-transpeptidase, partial [Sedimentisphaerales bacterium]|nr:L,D-transpeptidase [Sedimentisphaerales bacterium]